MSLFNDNLKNAKSRRKAILVHISGGSINNVILLVQGLILVPLYLHFIGDRLYGFWLASGGILAWLSVLNLGISSLTMQRCGGAYGRGDLGDVGRYFYTGLAVICVLCFAMLIVGVSVAWFIPQLLDVDLQWREVVGKCFALATGAFILSTLNDFFRNFCSSVQRNGFPVFAEVGGTTLGLIVTVCFLYANFGLYSLAIGFLVRAGFNCFVTGSYACWLIRTCGQPPGISLRVLGDYLKLAPAVMLSQLVSGLTGSIEPLLITVFLRPEIAVVFAVTQRALTALLPFVNQFIGASAGAFSHLFGEGRSEVLDKSLRTGILMIILSSMVVGIGFSLGNEGFVSLWVGSERYGGTILTALLAAAGVLGLYASFSRMMLGAHGDIVFTAYWGTVGSLLRVAIAGLLLYWIGVAGFPIAAILVSITSNYVFWRRASNRVHAISAMITWILPLVISALALIVIAAFCSQYVYSEGWLIWALAVFALTILISSPVLGFRSIRFVITRKMESIWMGRMQRQP